MNKRKMFIKMITASLIRRRSRMLVALLAIAVGAAILSGLVTIYIDVPRQMGAQFRNYGANMIFVAAGNDAEFNMETVAEAASVIDPEQLLGVTPYRYETVRMHEQPIVVAGTDMESAKITSPYWHVEGEWPDAENEILVGKNEAALLGLGIGDIVNATYSEKEGRESENAEEVIAAINGTEEETQETDNAKNDKETAAEGDTDTADSSGEETTEEYVVDLGVDMKVTGILETGGSEEDYIYLNMEDLMTLMKTDKERLDVVELSVSATADELTEYVNKITATSKNVSPRLVKRVTASESTVLTKLQALVFLVTAVVLVLMMICVATTMTAVVTERRKEIGLRKALGASDVSITREFMGEGLLLGGIGGLIGALLGFLFAQLVSVNVFSSSITFQPLLLIITIAVSILITGVACLIPVHGAIKIDPALVLKGE